MSAAPILTIMKGGETVSQQPIEGEAVLGRAEGCVIRLDDRAVSRQHAIFRAVPDGVQVEKRSEFGPVIVNGAETSKAVVREGDVINIGPYLLRVTIPKPAPAPVQAPPPVVEAPSIESPSSPTDPMTAPADAGLSMDGGMAGGEVSGMDAPAADLSAGGELAPPAEGMGDAGMQLDGQPPADGADAGISLDGGESPGIQMEQQDADAGEIVDDDAKTKLTPSAKLAVKLLFKPGTANHTEYELTGDEVSIGRGKNCDIVLNDKKSSRKNTIIRRAGMSFVVKDLDSANGTYVNGVRVKEQELAGGDAVRVGGVEFIFNAHSADYLAKEKDFMSLPAVVEEEPEQAQDPNAMMMGDPNAGQPPVDGMQQMMQAGGMDPNAAAGAAPGVDLQAGMIAGAAIPGIPGLGGAFSGKKTLKERFKALPKRTQMIMAVVGILVAYYVFIDDSDEGPDIIPGRKKKPKAGPSPTAIVAKGPMTYDSLPADKKRYVESQHALAFDYYKNKEYDKTLFEIGKIHELIPEFRDSREIERYAKEGKRKVEALEDEKRKKEEEARLKAKITLLVEETREKMSKKQYDQARELFPQILSMDPDNILVAGWRKEIDDEEEKKKQAEQEKNVQAQIDKRAQEVFNEAMGLFKHGKYHQCIGIFEKVGDTGTGDKKLVARSKKKIKEAMANIKAKFAPALAEAKAAEQAAEFSKAFKLYQKAMRIDPWSEKEPRAGMARIRGVLRERAKVLFTEAILYESYSDFTNATKKYRECLEIAPEDDEYHLKARRKLSHYFQRDVAGGGASP